MALKYIFWLVPVILFILQANLIFNSNNQIRFEELIESVQAPYWFYHQQLIAGTHTNVGWYAVLTIIYEIFGFSLNTPKFFILGLYGLSVICQALLIRKFFSPVIGGIVLLTLGLSPTLLTFNTQNLHLGVGLMVLPILIWLLMVLDFKDKILAKVITAVVSLVSIWALLVYPPFMFYLPAVGLFYLKKLFVPTSIVIPAEAGIQKTESAWIPHQVRDDKVLCLAVAALSFLLPVIFFFNYFSNNHLLIYDPDTGTGMFRGGGQLSFSEDSFSQAWSGLINDFFIKSVSYHFEADKVEFSDLYPIFSLLFVVYGIWKIYRGEKKSRFYINLILLTLIFNMAIISITSDYGIPGMKRSTPILASIYALWIIVWYYSVIPAKVGIQSNISGSRIKSGMTYVLLSLLTMHHLIAYPINLAHIRDLSPFADTQWFVTSGSPQQSLDAMVEKLQKEDLVLDCRPYLTEYTSCDLQFIYSALASTCLWNDLDCKQIRAYDITEGRVVDLSLEYFQR